MVTARRYGRRHTALPFRQGGGECPGRFPRHPIHPFVADALFMGRVMLPVPRFLPGTALESLIFSRPPPYAKPIILAKEKR